MRKLGSFVAPAAMALAFGIASHAFAQTGRVPVTYVDKRGEDVTVLQAWFGETSGIMDPSVARGGFSVRYPLDPSQCQLVDARAWDAPSGEKYERRTVNCRFVLEKQAGMFGRPSPAITDAIQVYDLRLRDKAISIQSGACETVELRTITPDDALNAPSFTGIGFYYANSGMGAMGRPDKGGFVRKPFLHPVGHVTLKDGRPATVHRFIAQGMCFGLGGNGGTIASRQTWFRPYAAFETASPSEVTVYRVWDGVDADYLLGRSPDLSRYFFTSSFDRQNELLRQ